MTVPQLEQWVDAGLLSREQAEAIARFEAEHLATPEPEPSATAGPSATPSVEPRAPSRRGAVVAEVVGSLGAIAAAVAAVVGTIVLWDDLTTAARVAVPAVGAILMLLAGAAVPREGDPSTSRLGALLWLLGIGATAATVAIGLNEVAEWDPQNISLACGVVVVALSLVLAPRRPEPHLVLALGGGLTLTTIGLVAQYDHAEPAQFGIALVAVGLGLMLFGWAGATVSTGAAYFAGGAIAFVGAELLGDAAEHWPVVVGATIGLATLAAFVVLRHRMLLVVGLVYALVFLVQGIILATDERTPGGGTSGTWVVLVAFSIGVLLLAGALYAMRRHDGHQPH